MPGARPTINKNGELLPKLGTGLQKYSGYFNFVEVRNFSNRLHFLQLGSYFMMLFS
jgi:hypothetical protein